LHLGGAETMPARMGLHLDAVAREVLGQRQGLRPQRFHTAQVAQVEPFATEGDEQQYRGEEDVAHADSVGGRRRGAKAGRRAR
jgi:hypothetical protein